MFTFPPSQWLGRQAGGVFYEHSHRLMGSLVGMLSIVLCAWAWKTEPRRWVRWLATGVLAAVIFQGVLGGLRVVLKELDAGGGGDVAGVGGGRPARRSPGGAQERSLRRKPWERGGGARAQDFPQPRRGERQHRR
jgi:hypothetical protein